MTDDELGDLGAPQTEEPPSTVLGQKRGRPGRKPKLPPPKRAETPKLTQTADEAFTTVKGRVSRALQKFGGELRGLAEIKLESKVVMGASVRDALAELIKEGFVEKVGTEYRLAKFAVEPRPAKPAPPARPLVDVAAITEQVKQERQAELREISVERLWTKVWEQMDISVEHPTDDIKLLMKLRQDNKLCEATAVGGIAAAATLMLDRLEELRQALRDLHERTKSP